jgi:crossover junction endodeoxyribonuclease RuvC
MTVTLGIDVGATGAVAALGPDGGLLAVDDLPYADGAVLAPVLADLVLAHGTAVAWVEQAQAYPGQGGSSGFKYGTGYGVILGVLGALDIPTQRVTPAVWKRAAGLGRDKGQARRRACELWPAAADRFARVRDDGRAEACLIARHGWLAMRRGAA